MSAVEFTPILVSSVEHRQDGKTLVAEVTVLMAHDEALKLAMSTSYAVRPGDRCSGPMRLAQVGAALATLA